MNEPDPRFGKWVNREIALASIVTLVGLVLVLLFLVRGIGAITMGLGTFIGIPLVVVGILIYLGAVVHDLRRRGAL